LSRHCLTPTGRTASQLIGWLAARLGLRQSETPLAAGDLIDGFDLSHIANARREIPVDLAL
jgi:hypothetical protein